MKVASYFSSINRTAALPVAMVSGFFALVIAAESPALAADAVTICARSSGKVATRCLTRAARRLDGMASPLAGTISDLISTVKRQAIRRCGVPEAEALGYTTVPDVSTRAAQACQDFSFEIARIVFAADAAGLTPAQASCRSLVYRYTRRVVKNVNAAWGPNCLLDEYKGGACDRARRDQRVAKIRFKAERRIDRACGSDFDAVLTFEGASLAERIADFVDLAVTRGRHFAQRLYPPNSLEPSANSGSFPVGLQTLDLLDVSRLDVSGTGSRPVTVEVYYPSTEAAIEGVPREEVRILGFRIAVVPAYRDVAIAPGTYPLVIFSHGNFGIRTQSFFFAAHLASHGYIVVSPDHHGNTFLDALDGIEDPDVAANRPLDMSFLLDEFLSFNQTPGDFFENSIDPARIGASGHSFGGLTALLLAGGDTGFGAATDTRVAAIFPQAPAAPFEDAFFGTITVPTLIVGGSIDGITPFDVHQQRPFDLLPSGAAVVGLAKLNNAGHFTFSDFCEVPGTFLAFLGGAEEACEPRHLPWRYAQDITKYLALNFFDAVLNGDPEALGRLSPTVLDAFEDFEYQSK
ncbi:MAG: alpha/beta hydrolase family protein [Candidatus Binatia bacterium]